MTLTDPISRRSVLQGSVALASIAIPGWARASLSTPGQASQVGIQLVSFEQALRSFPDQTFRHLSALGFSVAELAGFAGHSPQTLMAAAKNHKIDIVSLHVPPEPFGTYSGPTFKDDPEVIIEAAHQLGVTRIVMPLFPLPPGFAIATGEGIADALLRVVNAGGTEMWHRTAAELNRLGNILAQAGIRLSYHNHNLEFAPIGSDSGWDILFREVSPSAADFQIDVGWIAAAGIDVGDFLARHAARIGMLHLKDMKRPARASFKPQLNSVPIGQGDLDWPSLACAIFHSGIRYSFIEQEMPPSNDPFDDARRSIGYLRKLAV